MLRKANIRMKNIQSPEEGENADELEFFTDALYTYEAGSGCFTYQESELTGMSGTQTTILFNQEEMVIDRKGTINSRMCFRPGESTAVLMNTPFGEARLGVTTRSLSGSATEEGGELTVDYVLDLEHSMSIICKLIINIESGELINA